MICHVTENMRVVNDDEIVLSSKEQENTVAVLMKPDFTTETIFIGDKQVPLTKESGHFFGMYLGNGWCDANSNGIYIATIHENIKDIFISYVNSFLRDHSSKGMKYENSEHYFEGFKSVHGKAYAYIQSQTRNGMLNLFGKGALSKRIPEEILTSSRECRIGLLSGLLDTDGSISCRDIIKKGKMQQNKNIMYSTSSPQLAIDVQKLCMSLGINASITIVKRNINDEFTIVLSSIDTFSIRDSLCLSTEKIKTLNSFTFGEQVNPKDILPYPISFDKHLKDHYNMKFISVLNTARIRGYITRDTAFSVLTKEQLSKLDEMYGIYENKFEKVVYSKQISKDHIDVDTTIFLIKEAKAYAKKTD